MNVNWLSDVRRKEMIKRDLSNTNEYVEYMQISEAIPQAASIV